MLIKKNKLLLLLIFSFAAINGHCQQRLRLPEHERICRIDPDYNPAFKPDNFIDIYEPNEKMKQIWKEILTITKHEDINAHLMQAEGQRFESFVQDGTTWIVYDNNILNEWINNPNYLWIIRFCLCHELAHLVLQHSISAGINEQYERQADHWACQQLCGMHANAEQAKSAITLIIPSLGKKVLGYPSKSDRIEAIEKYFSTNICGEPSGGILVGNNIIKNCNDFQTVFNDICQNTISTQGFSTLKNLYAFSDRLYPLLRNCTENGEKSFKSRDDFKLQILDELVLECGVLTKYVEYFKYLEIMGNLGSTRALDKLTTIYNKEFREGVIDEKFRNSQSGRIATYSVTGENLEGTIKTKEEFLEKARYWEQKKSEQTLWH